MSEKNQWEDAEIISEASVHEAQGSEGVADAGDGALNRKDGTMESVNRLFGRPFPTVGDVFAMFGIAVGVLCLVRLLIMLLDVLLFGAHNNPDDAGRFEAMAYFLSMLPAVFAVWLYRYCRGGGKRLAHFSTNGFNAVILLWAFVLMCAITVVSEPLTALLPEVDFSRLGHGGWTILAVVVMAPVLEEVLCRGLVLESVRKRYGVVVALLSSSLFFGCMHLHPTQVICATMLGLVLGYIYIVTNSLWASVILHAMNNALAYILLVAGLGNMKFIDLIENRTLYILIYIGACVVTVVSGYMIWRKLKELKTEKMQAEE